MLVNNTEERNRMDMDRSAFTRMRSVLRVRYVVERVARTWVSSTWPSFAIFCIASG